jgi:hypothetical protein
MGLHVGDEPGFAHILWRFDEHDRLTGGRLQQFLETAHLFFAIDEQLLPVVAHAPFSDE